MKNSVWYKCSDSKTGNWPEGEYLIDYANSNQTSIAIWHNNQWAATGYRSVKKAHATLTNEFNNVKKMDR